MISGFHSRPWFVKSFFEAVNLTKKLKSRRTRWIDISLWKDSSCGSSHFHWSFQGISVWHSIRWRIFKWEISIFRDTFVIYFDPIVSARNHNFPLESTIKICLTYIIVIISSRLVGPVELVLQLLSIRDRWTSVRLISTNHIINNSVMEYQRNARPSQRCPICHRKLTESLLTTDWGTH